MGKKTATNKSKPIYIPFSNRNGKRPEVIITPSVLSCNFAYAAQELAKCRRARARWVHIDVMDGHFVPNITIGPPVLKAWAASEPDLFYDTHLMIEKPMNYAEQFVAAGSHLITIHIETTHRPRHDLRAIKRLGVKVGVTIKPRTPVKSIAPLLDEVDLVLVMTVEPGFGGQALIPRTLNKVRELDLIRSKEGLPFRLQVDGGINKATSPLAVAAGADVLVAGNAVFKEGDVRGNLKVLRAALSSDNP